MAFFKRLVQTGERTDDPAKPTLPDIPTVNDELVIADAPATSTRPRPDTSSEAPKSTSALSGLGGLQFVHETPQFSATIPSHTPNIDVTPRAAVKVPVPTPAQPAPRPSPQPTPEPEQAPLQGKHDSRLNLGTLREDMARITADIYTDIEQGDTLYRRAQKRVEGLMGFVEKAELDYTAINRLEPENRRLKAKNIDLTQEIETQEERIVSIQTTLSNQRRQLVDTQELLDDSRRKLASAMTAVKRRDDDLRKALRAVDQLTTKIERQSITTNVESSENVTLRTKLRELSSELTRLNQEKLMQAKMIDSLRGDYDTLRTTRGTSQANTTHLKTALAASKKRNAELLSHLESLQSDIKAFKTQYEFNVTNRDRRIIQLESEVEKLERQVSIKEEVISESAKSVTEMRDSKDTQELDYARLEKIIADQTQKMSEMRKDLHESQKKGVQYERHIQAQKRVNDSDDLARLEQIIEQQRARIEDLQKQTPMGYANSNANDIMRLEQIIGDQQRELTETRAQIAAHRATSTERDKRYDEVTRALEDTQSRLDAQIPAEQPDIIPDPALESAPESVPESAQDSDEADDAVESVSDDNDSVVDEADSETLTEESIDDMILDYKLGHREKLG